MNKRIKLALLTALSVLILAAVLVLPASAATSISKAVITYKTTYSYTGSYIKPKVTVKVGKKTLTASDYTVSYKNNKNVGVATLTVKGKGNYTGSVSKKYNITPAAPKNFKATSVTTTSVKLSWSKCTGAASYELYIYNSATKQWNRKATLSTTSATVKSLQPGTAYQFRVRALSNTTKVLCSPYSNLTVKTPVAKVKSLKAESAENSIKLSWASVKNATGYQIYMYDTAAKKWVHKKTVSSTSYKLTKLATATTYQFKVRARNTAKPKTVYGEYSAVLTTATCPVAVSGVKVSSFTSTSASLEWKAAKGATGYDVYAGQSATADGTPTYTLVKTTTSLKTKLTGLDTCCYYTFRVVSRYRNTAGKIFYGDFKNSCSDTVFTPIAKVSGLTVTETTNNSSTITWKPQPYSSGYYMNIKQGADGEIVKVATLPSTQSTYTFEGLQELTDYKFYVGVFYIDANGNEIKSGGKGISTLTDDSSVDSIAFTRAKSSLTVGSTYQFKAAVSPSYAANTKKTFSSSNPSVATISEKGLVTAIKAGTAVISVKSDEGDFTDSVTLKVTNVKSKSISLPATITAYMNETTQILPTFTPANTTDKSFTVTGKNHKYTYQGGILGLTDKEDTCVFSDYVTITSDGRIIPKKLTIEPETGERFSFKITVKTKDSGVTVTAKLVIDTRPMKISYQGTDIPWEYGNSAKLTATLSSNATFKKDQIIWESSDNTVAYVDTDGTVYCTGAGAVTITAYSPDKSVSSSLSIYVRPKITVENRFYSGCSVGDEYTITASVLPESSGYAFTSLQPKMLSVDENGRVTVLEEGTATILVSSGNATESVIFTTKTWTKPEADEESLFTTAKDVMNLVKKETPMLIRSTSSVFDNFSMSNPKETLTSADLKDLFSDFANPSTIVVNTLSSSATSTEKQSYYKQIPVSGQSLTVLSGLELSALKNIRYIDRNGPTYDIVFTLMPETMSTPTAANSGTNHGKVFDILTGTYLNTCINALNSGESGALGSVDVSYTGFSQYYSNCTVTVTVDKLTGKAEYIDYDMNIAINISGLKISMGVVNALNSDLAFTVNNKLEIDVIN